MTSTVSFRPGELELTDEGAHLLGSRCSQCGAHFFPVREVCARCLNEPLETLPLSTDGVVYTFSVVRQSTPAFPVPYVLAYVDLPEGARVMGQITGCEIEDVEIGMEVELVTAEWGADEEGRTQIGYRFKPKERR